MSDVLNLEEELRQAQARFNALEDERQSIQKQIAELNRKNSEILTEEVRIQGENRIIEKLLKKEKPQVS